MNYSFLWSNWSLSNNICGRLRVLQGISCLEMTCEQVLALLLPCCVWFGRLAAIWRQIKTERFHKNEHQRPAGWHVFSLYIFFLPYFLLQFFHNVLGHQIFIVTNFCSNCFCHKLMHIFFSPQFLSKSFHFFYQRIFLSLNILLS